MGAAAGTDGQESSEQLLELQRDRQSLQEQLTEQKQGHQASLRKLQQRLSSAGFSTQVRLACLLICGSGTCWSIADEVLGLVAVNASHVHVQRHSHGMVIKLHVQDITSFTNEAYEGEQLSSQQGTLVCIAAICTTR